MTTRDAVVAEANSWLRTPYHHQGCIKGAGVDCAMLLIGVYRACGLIPAIDPRPYSEQWMMHRNEELFLKWLDEYGYGIPFDQVLPGDVAVWKFGRTYSHGAIIISKTGDMIHAYMQARSVVLGNVKDSELASRAVKFYRVKGIQ